LWEATDTLTVPAESDATRAPAIDAGSLSNDIDLLLGRTPPADRHDEYEMLTRLQNAGAGVFDRLAVDLAKASAERADDDEAARRFRVVLAHAVRCTPVSADVAEPAATASETTGEPAVGLSPTRRTQSLTARLALWLAAARRAGPPPAPGQLAATWRQLADEARTDDDLRRTGLCEEHMVVQLIRAVLSLPDDRMAEPLAHCVDMQVGPTFFSSLLADMPPDCAGPAVLRLAEQIATRILADRSNGEGWTDNQLADVERVLRLAAPLPDDFQRKVMDSLEPILTPA
jgi:hypothetical protein